MKPILTFASIALLILSIAIIYLGSQRESLFNPPIITGIGFVVIALVFIVWKKQIDRKAAD
nr:hypothetical protein [uncultured Allomuricauda sp.]